MDGGDDAAKRTRVTAEGSVAAEIKTATVAYKNPFLGEKLYRAHSSRFKVGEKAKYCVPFEFDILFCIVQLGTVCVYAQGDRKRNTTAYGCCSVSRSCRWCGVEISSPTPFNRWSGSVGW